MEIIHIILGKANPHRSNGVNKVVFNLVSEQVKMGLDVEVWGITYTPQERPTDYPFALRLFKDQKYPFALDPNLRQAIECLPASTVVHLHGGWIPQYYAVAKYLVRNNLKYVLTPHGAYNAIAMIRSKWRKRIYLALFERFVISNADCIHCLGDSEVDGVESICRGVHTKIIPYGFSGSEMGVQRVDRSSFRIGFLGRIDIYTKGLDLILKAYKQLEHRLENSELVIVGDGKEMPKLREMIKSLAFQNRVTLTGSKYGVEKDREIVKMDIFLHPSRNEGLPNAPLEAASMGVPSIVSKATNLASYINEYQAGLVISDGDAVGLATAIETLYKRYVDGSLTVLGSNCKEMIQEAFSWSHIIDQFSLMYDEIGN